MKLFTCIECEDVRRLRERRTYCQCRKAWAKYTDAKQHEAVANHYALIIGIDSQELRAALTRKVEHMRGSQRFSAFLLPEPCTTVARVGRLAL